MMIYASETVTVNPSGEAALTREQAWSGLVLKARDDRTFLPAGVCTSCDIVEESATYFVRDAVIRGEHLREIVGFEPETKVSFLQVSGPREGVIINELIVDEAGALQLRFYCYLGLRGQQPGGVEERAEEARLSSNQGYRRALLSTLSRTRELVRAGSL